ncbi:MAG TPA: bifunctional diaminohydroxyphosphoribosylaminopyrimidine deaminase/5-amino-6-(5-phosphoribosylamino)uracil reductase RibD [Stellaceae bacterium]|nr:bifunctional diaminohydroxyphosphoribosylaminopyrimidine deaminase/5-amino-6-(5-phosphoribosylamino)uracil reductase RibD [Stellaceae bacterium]
MNDLAAMRAALALARRGLGNTWPNPAVGCVLVNEGRVVGRGWTQPGGRPHAETEALRRAGPAAKGATAYVTLEPCAHHGKTPPCAGALIAAGVARVAAAIEDPDPRVAGKGLARLRAAGIVVDEGLCAAEAEEVNAGFLQRVRTGRPLVTLKLAATLDGRIATASGESRWITGPAARERAHALRAGHDAILVGTGTVIADDPELTCRLPGLTDRSPLRIVFDRHLRIPPAARVFAPPCWVLTAAPDAPELRARGVEVVPAPPDLGETLRVLGARGLTRVLVEGGGRLAASLLAAGLVDRLVWMRAPMAIGGEGIPAIAALGLARLADAPRFELVSSVTIGGDVVETYRRSP